MTSADASPPADPPAATGREGLIAAALAAQNPAGWIGVALDAVEPGQVTLSFAVRDELCTAGTGVVMGGIVATVADMAAGLSVVAGLREPRPVTTLEFTSHQIAPAQGQRIVAAGKVERIGRHVAVTGAEVYAVSDDGTRRLCARLMATFAIN